MALPDLPGGEKCCHLEVSWRVNFLHSTLMKGVIEGGARSGIRDNYILYKEVHIIDFFWFQLNSDNFFLSTNLLHIEMDPKFLQDRLRNISQSEAVHKFLLSYYPFCCLESPGIFFSEIIVRDLNLYLPPDSCKACKTYFNW